MSVLARVYPFVVFISDQPRVFFDTDHDGSGLSKGVNPEPVTFVLYLLHDLSHAQTEIRYGDCF